MSWEGWAAVAAICALAIDVVRRLISEAHDKGRRVEQEKQQRKDIDGIGRKVEAIRTELKDDIAEVRGDHDALREKVNEIALTVASSHAMLAGVATSLDRLIVAHTKETGDMR